jgi:sulfate transport system ATP-binding protein
VLFGGQDALARKVVERRVGLVFQHYALFRHMTVFENIAFGLRVRPRHQRLGRAEITRRVEELLHRVQLDQLAGRYPTQLSGGQRQRVALARALAIEPAVLLLDEPFGALDAKVRKELRRWLRNLHETVQVTSVFVTHDQDEALELADRVVVIAEGRIEQIGPPATVYAHPATEFVTSSWAIPTAWPAGSRAAVCCWPTAPVLAGSRHRLATRWSTCAHTTSRCVRAQMGRGSSATSTWPARWPG